MGRLLLTVLTSKSISSPCLGGVVVISNYFILGRNRVTGEKKGPYGCQVLTAIIVLVLAWSRGRSNDAVDVLDIDVDVASYVMEFVSSKDVAGDWS